MEKKSKKQVIIAVTVLLLVTLTLLGITYAYYRTRIIGNKNDKSISVTSKSLELTYSEDTALISASDIEPGYTTTKTFSVENTGDDTITDYVVFLENVENTFNRTEDWTYVLECTSTGESCEGSSGTFPEGEKILITNDIESGVTHSYELTITYANLKDVNQSEDMGKTISAKVNIRDKDSNNPYTSNKDLLAYNVISNAMIGANGTEYRTETVSEVAKETSAKAYIGYDSSGTKTITSSSYVAYIDDIELVDGDGWIDYSDVTIAKYSDVYSDLVGKYIYDLPVSNSNINISDTWDIAYKITSANETSFTYDLYYSNYDISRESTLSVANDDYGDSYYYRGDVEDNYLTFNNMCWRIVRIQGDGSIKIVLADDENPCSGENYSTSDPESGYMSLSSIWGDSGSLAGYNSSASNSLKNILNVFLNGGTYDGTTYTAFSDAAKSKLKNDTWCIGDSNTLTRLSGNEKTSTLKCSGETIDAQIGALTADEVVHAGAKYKTPNVMSYITKNAEIDSWWLMSVASSSTAFNSGGWMLELGEWPVDASVGYTIIRPVVTLIPGIEITEGNGTVESPYIVKES